MTMPETNQNPTDEPIRDCGVEVDESTLEDVSGGARHAKPKHRRRLEWPLGDDEQESGGATGSW